MPISKDSQYWKVYNQKRKEYLAHKARERRAKEKAESIQPNQEPFRIQPPEIKAYTTELRIQPNQEVVDHPPNRLPQLVKEWQTSTNYNCASTCTYAYCSNCWYFTDDQLVNYKGL